jgi:ABC-type sulfate transport system substrate-binding protein
MTFDSIRLLKPLSIRKAPNRVSSRSSLRRSKMVSRGTQRIASPSVKTPIRNDRISRTARRSIFSWSVVLALVVGGLCGCRRESRSAKDATITLYGFSVVKEALEKEIFPAYQAEWKAKTGQQLIFEPSYAGSEIVTNQIIAGVEADVAILSIERNADRLMRPDVARNDWHKLPYGGIVNKTPIVLVVREGNPKRIEDYPDLAKPGVKIIHADPISSGVGQWSLLAMYGSEIMKSEAATGWRDEKRAFDLLWKIWKSSNILATPESARQARTQFERGEGDVLVTYELEALQLREKKLPIEVITPRSTIFCEHPVVIIDHQMSPEKYAIVELFVRSLWEPKSQQAWVNAHFRSVTDEKFNQNFAKIETPFYAKDLGGWTRAYPEIVDGLWKQKIQESK